MVYYDGVISKPPLDEALAHYGVLGMKWGIRKELSSTGRISERTRKKVSKALSKASYNKHRKILNALSDLEADSKGKKYLWEESVKRGNSANKSKKGNRLSKLNSKIGKTYLDKQRSRYKEINSLYSEAQKSAKSKGYKYDIDSIRKRAKNEHTGVIESRIKDKTTKFRTKNGDTPYFVKRNKYKKKK